MKNNENEVDRPIPFWVAVLMLITMVGVLGMMIPMDLEGNLKVIGLGTLILAVIYIVRGILRRKKEAANRV